MNFNLYFSHYGYGLVTIVLILITTGLTSYLLLKNCSFFRLIWLVISLPGPYAYPLIGNTYMVFNHAHLRYLGSHAREMFGPVIRVWVTVLPVIFILEPKDIHKIISSKLHIEKPFYYNWVTNLVGRGLVTSNGAHWKKNRKCIQPAFSLDYLKQFMPIVEESAFKLVVKINESLNEGKSCLNIAPFMNETVFEILSKVVLGMSWKEVEEVTQTKSSPFRSGSFTLTERLRHPWLMFDCLYHYTKSGKQDDNHRRLIEECTSNLIIQRKHRKIGSSNTISTSLLDFMIDSNLSHEECINEVSTFMLAGQDTVAGALTFTLYMLAVHPEIQGKARSEVDSYAEDRGGKNCDFYSFPYLEQCIKETLRLFPSITVFARKLGEDVTLDKYCLPRGTNVIISPYATHRLAKHFPEPEKYNPGRFNVSNTANRHPCAYIPFSAGPRNCIGSKLSMIEMLTIVSSILKNFSLSISPKNKELSLKYRLTIRASGGVWLAFKKR